MNEQRVTVWVQRFKDRPALMLQWTDPETGRRKSKSAGTDDPKEAERARADLQYELTHGKYQESSKLDWDKFRELFETEYAAMLRPTSREKYGAVLDVFEDLAKPRRLKTITERTLSRFLKDMRERKRRDGKTGLAPYTMRNYLVALKTVLGWAVEQKLLPALPTFPTVKVPKKKPQPIAAESFEKLLEKAPDELWRAYLLCGWWAGLRLSEARQLRWNPSDDFPWVEFERNRIALPAKFAKSNEDQWVPLHPLLREALAALPHTSLQVFPFRSRYTGGPMTRNAITHAIRTMAKRAGVKLSMHRLRKGFGCRVAKQLGKGNAPILHELMRHSSMQITMDYYASVGDALQDAIKALR
jgi:integrase